MSSDSDSSFDLLDSDASSDFSMESFDDVKVGELDDFSDSSFEDAIPDTSDVKMISETSTGDVVTSQDAIIESPKPQMPEAFKITLSSVDAVTGLEGTDATAKAWRNQVTTGLRNRLVYEIIETVVPDRTFVTDDSYLQFVSAVFLREQMCFEKAKNLKEYYYLVAEDFYSVQTMMTQATEDVRQPKIGKVGEFSEDNSEAMIFWDDLELRKKFKDILVELITGIYPDFPSELCEAFATAQELTNFQLAIRYGDYCSKISKEIDNIRKGVSEREARERFIERMTSQLHTQPSDLRCMQITTILKEFASSKMMNGSVEIYKELTEIAVEIEQKISWFAIGFEARFEAESPKPQMPEATETTPSESTDVQEPLPILEEIEGTWKLIARHSFEEGFVRRTEFNDDGPGYRMKFNVQDSRVEISKFLPSGALEYQWTSPIVPRNPFYSDEARPHEYVEDNQWYTVKASDNWCKKTIQNGQLLVDFVYHHTCFTNVFVRVQDDVATSSEPIPNTKASTERTIPQKTSVATQTTEESMEEVSSEAIPNTEASTEVPLLQKTSEDTQTIEEPLEEVSSESESPKIPSSSESTQETNSEQEKPTPLPILEEINGTWEIIAIENLQEFCETTGFVCDIRLGERDKVDVQGSSLKLSVFSSSGNSIFSRTALIAPKNSWTSMSFIHDYVKNNQWYTVYRASKDWRRRVIQDGLLRVEYHSGPEFFTCVFKKIQDDTTPTPTPQVASDPAHPHPIFLIIIITAVITFLLTKLFF